MIEIAAVLGVILTPWVVAVMAVDEICRWVADTFFSVRCGVYGGYAP